MASINDLPLAEDVTNQNDISSLPLAEDVNHGIIDTAIDTASALWDTAKSVPGGIVDTYKGAYRYGDLDVTDPGLWQQIDEGKATRQRFLNDHPAVNEGVLGGMESVPFSLAGSGVSTAGMLGAGALTIASGGTATPAAAALGTGAIAAGSVVGGRAAADQFILDHADTLRQQLGRVPTQEEWQAYYDQKGLGTAKTIYAVAEGGFEMLGDVLTGGIANKVLLAPAKKAAFAAAERALAEGATEEVAKIAARDAAAAFVKKNAVAMGVGGLAVDTVGELGGETATEVVQGAQEAATGLRDHAPTVGEAFQEVAIPTLTMQGMFMGGGAVATGVHRAGSRVKDTLMPGDTFVDETLTPAPVPIAADKPIDLMAQQRPSAPFETVPFVDPGGEPFAGADSFTPMGMMSPNITPHLDANKTVDLMETPATHDVADFDSPVDMIPLGMLAPTVRPPMNTHVMAGVNDSSGKHEVLAVGDQQRMEAFMQKHGGLYTTHSGLGVYEHPSVALDDAQATFVPPAQPVAPVAPVEAQPIAPVSPAPTMATAEQQKTKYSDAIDALFSGQENRISLNKKFGADISAQIVKAVQDRKNAELVGAQWSYPKDSDIEKAANNAAAKRNREREFAFSEEGQKAAEKEFYDNLKAQQDEAHSIGIEFANAHREIVSGMKTGDVIEYDSIPMWEVRVSESGNILLKPLGEVSSVGEIRGWSADGTARSILLGLKDGFYTKKGANTESATSDQDRNRDGGGFDLKPISDKAFVVTGDTKPIKDQLKSAGGKWNSKHRGWMFSNKRQEEVESLLAGVGQPTATAPEVPNEAQGQAQAEALLAQEPTATAQKAQPAQEAAPVQPAQAQEDVGAKIDIAKRRLQDARRDLKKAQFAPASVREDKGQKVAEIESEIRGLRSVVFDDQSAATAKDDQGITLDEARAALADMKTELRAQGQESQVHDDRLVERVRKFEILISELEQEGIAIPKADAVKSKREESPKEASNAPLSPAEPELLPAVGRQTDVVDGQSAGSAAGNVQETEGADEAPGRADGARSVGGAPREKGRDARGRSTRDQYGDGGASGRTGTDKRESAGADADGRAQEVPDLGRQTARQNAQNHRVADEDTLVPGGTVARAKANIAAIKLLKELQAESRDATADEKRVLTQFTGWGSLAQEVFKPEYDNAAEYEGRYGRAYPGLAYNRQAAESYDKWKDRYGKALHPALGGMMTEAEWDAAKKSTLNAHYTDRNVINAIWRMAERMGFAGGRVLEPSAGTGLFFGLMPEDIAERSRLVGVELDNVTGGILQKLYPDADIQVTGFENAKRIGDNSFDMVVSNFPFGSFQVYDKARPEYSKQSIHNYFFSRAIDAVRPGGLVMGITSHFTMDAGGAGKVREMWGQKADLVAAVRLPGTAFEKNAGTQVTTDIIILRKKTDTPYKGEPFRHLAEVQTQEGPTHINEYFVQHPEMVLGEHSLRGSMYGGKDEYTLKPSNDEDLNAALARVVELLPQNIAGRDVSPIQDVAQVQSADEGMREGTIVEKGGKVFVVADGALESPEWAKSAKKVKQARAYLGVKGAAMDLIKAMNTDEGDANVNSLRAKLNEVYDAYVEEHGAINKSGNKHLEDDLEFPTVAALEASVDVPVVKTFKTGPHKGQTYDITKRVFSKADIFSKRTIYPFVEPSTADNITDAVKISRVYRNSVNVPFIAGLLGMDTDAARAELLKTGDVFENPESGLVEPKDIYLSGNVREKLRVAERAANDNPAYQANVDALQKVMPDRLSIDAIHVRIGSAWVPADIIKSFMEHIGISYPRAERIRIEGEEGSTQWVVDGQPGADARNKWGVEGADAMDLISDALNLKRSEVFDTYQEDGKTKRVKNAQKSLAAQEKQRALQEEFRRWVKEDDAAAKIVEEVYNDTFNGHVARKFDAPNVKFYPGASQTIELRENQKIGVSRALQESTLLAHGVGSGKTYLQITLAMEMRRLGTAKKPWIVVQGSTLPQFAASFKRLYPGARILAPNEEQRKAKNRQRLLAQIASGDWDAVITPHGFFNSISIDPENESRFIMERIDEFKEQIRADYGDKALSSTRETSPTVKAIQRKIEKMKVRLKKLTDTKKDANIFFEQLGVDALIIDEAHAYKRGDFYTKMDNVKGLDRDSSQRSMQMLMKSRHVQEKTGGKNVILATGTPISNTLTEMWTMFRYTRPDLLKAFGVEQFDDFASTFADTTVSLEETSTGDFKDVERFNRFVNGPELLTMWRMGADVAITENLDYIKGLPKLAGGKVQEVAVDRSEALTNYIRELKAERDAWDRLSGKEKRESSHVPLVIYGKAKKAAIDLRLVDADLADTADSKANAVVDSVFVRWQQHKDNKAAQIIFSDIFQSSDKRFNLFHDIRDKLVARGVPAGEIAIIHDFKTDDARGKLFDKVNEGSVRVLMGTTEKLGVGVNVQERLVAAHHIDAPLRPMDFEQRNGRIRRPGNMFPEVEVFAYGTKNTLDSVTFQQLIAKQKFINQMMRGDMGNRVFENPFDEVQATFEDMMAAFSGNPMAKEKMKLQADIRRLESLHSAYTSRLSKMRYELRHAHAMLDGAQKQLPRDEKVVEFVSKNFQDGKIADRKEIAKDISEWLHTAETSTIARIKDVNTHDHWRTINPKKLSQSRVFDLGHGVTAEVTVMPAVSIDSHGDIIERFANTDYYLSGPHKIDDSQSFNGASGMLMRVENFLSKSLGRAEATRQRIANLEEQIASLGAELKKPFDQADDLDRAQQRMGEIEKELAASKNEDLEASMVSLADKLGEAETAIVAVQHIADTTPNESYKAIANKILETLSQDVRLVVVNPDEKVPGGVPTSLNTAAGVYRKDKDRHAIYLRGDGFAENGMNEETVLHEALHAVVIDKVRGGNLVKNNGTDLFDAVQSLYKLQHAVVRAIDERIKGGQASDYEQRLVTQMSVSDVNELVSWSMTNKQFQEMLRSIPYDSGSAFTKFVSSIMRMLGLNQSERNALTELISVTDRILDAEEKPSYFRPQFRRDGRASGTRASDVQAAIDPMLGSLFAGIDVRVIQSAKDLPEDSYQQMVDAKAVNEAMGVHRRGVNYLIADNISNVDDALFVLKHEIFHDGVRRMRQRFIDKYGDDEASRKMNRIIDMAFAANKNRVMSLKEAYKDDFPDLSDVKQRRGLTEEWLANQSALQSPRWYDSYVAALREFFRAVGKKLGIRLEFSDSELRAFIGRVQSETGAYGDADGVAYMRPEDVTQTAAFKKWFGDSKVVDKQGKPLVVYHTTPSSEIEAFDRSFLGRTTGENTDSKEAINMAKLGFWFADSDVSSKASVPSGSTYPVYLNLNNPRVFRTFDSMWKSASKFKDADRWRASLEKQGYDGVIVRNDTEFNVSSYVAFYPTQIKSVFNRGTFDANDPRINYMRKGGLPSASDAMTVIDSFGDNDLSTLRTVIGLPSGIAKEHPTFKRIYKRQLERVDRKMAQTSEALGGMSELFGKRGERLNAKERKQLVDFLWRWDGKQPEGMNEEDTPKFLVKEQAGTHLILWKNPEWNEAYREWLGTHGLPEKVVDAAYNLRLTMDNVMLETHNTLSRMSEVPKSLLEDIRSNIRHVNNYIPHSRYGEYGIAFYGADKQVLYREHYDAVNASVAKIKANKRIKELRKEYPEAARVWAGKNRSMPEELFENVMNMEAMEQMLFAAVDKNTDDKDLAADLKQGITEAAADLFKARGFMSHTIGRQNIPGYERENIERVIFDYINGAYGFLEKLAFAKDATAHLKGIKPKDQPGLHAYGATYVKNMLRNSDKVDRIVSNVKALAFVWFLGGVAKTATINATQNIITGAPTLGKYTKGSSYARVFEAAMRSIVKGRLSEDEKRLIHELHNEGKTQAHMMREIEGRVSGKLGAIGNKVVTVLGWPMAKAEEFNRVSLALAAYRAAVSGSLTDDTRNRYGIIGEATYKEAKRFASDLVDEAHFVLGKANMPQPLRSSKAGRMLSPAYTFRSFNHNLMEWWYGSIRDHGWNTGGKAVLQSLAGTMLLGGMRATPFAATAMALFNWLAPLWGGTGDDDWMEALGRKLKQWLPEYDWFRDMVLFGLPSFAKIDLGGSLRLEAPLIDKNQKNRRGDILGDAVGEAIGIPYAMGQMVVRAKTAAEAGNTARAIEELAPVVAKNAMSAYRLATKGAYTAGGSPVMDPATMQPKKISGGEAVGKVLGFQPLSLTKASVKQAAIDHSDAVRQEKQAMFTNRLSNAARDGNPAAFAANMKAMKDWNAKVIKEKDGALMIKPDDVMQQVRQRMKGQKLNPREMYRAMQLIDAYGK